MKTILISAWLCAAFAAPHAWAQTRDDQALSASAPSSAMPGKTPATTLGSYRPYAEPSISPWLESNAQVARKGGWKAYAREASGREEAGTTPPSNAASGAERADGKPASPHGGHLR